MWPHLVFLTQQFSPLWPQFWCKLVSTLSDVHLIFFFQIDGVPGLAVTLFGLLLELHKDEEMVKKSVDQQVGNKSNLEFMQYNGQYWQIIRETSVQFIYLYFSVLFVT